MNNEEQERKHRIWSFLDVAQLMGTDIFMEHVMPHVVFRPTPLAKIMQESIKNAILEQWGCVLGAIGIDDALDYPVDWDLVPHYAVRELEDFMYDEELGYRDVAHLEQPNALSEAIWNSILTKEWVIEKPMPPSDEWFSHWPSASSDDEDSEEEDEDED